MLAAPGPGVIAEMRAALADPAMRHAMLVHLPVAMSSLGVVVAFVAAFWHRSRTPRVLACVWYAVMTVAAFMAMQSGERAEAALPPHLSADAFARLDLHEEMGGWLYLFAGAAALLFLVTLVRDRIVRYLAMCLAVATAVLCAGWTAVVAHHGGTLVYEFGGGTRPALRTPSAIELDEARDDAAPGSMGDVETAGASSAQAIDPQTAARIAYFTDTIEPILAARCQSCHNARRPKSGLDLTTLQGALAGGDLGEPALVAGDRQNSLMLVVVRGLHPEIEQMPPDDPLPQEEIAALERWILDGAVWPPDGGRS